MPISIENPEDMSDSKKMLVFSLGLQNAQNKITEHEARLDDLDKLILTGDGRNLPAMERLRNMEKFVEDFRYWSRLVAGAVLLQTLAFASAAIWYAIKLLPVLERIQELP